VTGPEVVLRMFLAIAVILGACRLVGWVARLLGQPQAIAEMVAGLWLGPSVLGLVSGGSVQEWLFPPELKLVLYAMAQVGLALYMFLVGAEFRLDLLGERTRAAASISIAGMLVPFALGVSVALILLKDPTLFGPRVSPLQATLFMGAAMSITAFPMLARLIEATNLAGTRLGSIVLAAGAINDGAAWCVLAVVISLFKSDSWIAVKTVGGGIAYVAVVMVVGRPMLRWLLTPVSRAPTAEGPLPAPMFALVLILLALGAWFTDWVGVHAVFGAFFLGVVMPRGEVTTHLRRLIDPLTSALLVPMFFVFAGLNTRVGLLDSWGHWGIAALVLATACVGKFVACALASRLAGEPWRESWAAGALMNARGMMELIILNIGLERGIITPTLYSIGVLMAIVTTVMAAPLFEWVYGNRRAAVARAQESVSAGQLERISPKLEAGAGAHDLLEAFSSQGKTPHEDREAGQ
jgi:Kef-type K+ transport system membrane component KefB